MHQSRQNMDNVYSWMILHLRVEIIQKYKYIFFGSQMTGLMGCVNLDCRWTKEVKRLLAAVHMKKVMRERCEGRRVE